MIPTTNIIILGIVVGMVLAYSVQHFFAIISQKSSLLSKPMICESCGERQPLFHRIPIISAFFSRGKCQVCGHEPPRIYAVIEFFVFIFSVGAFSLVHPALALQISLLFFALIGISYMDIKKWMIPNGFIIMILIAGVLGLLWGTVLLEHALFGLVVAGVVSLFIVLPQRYGPGDKTLALGDVKLVFSISLWLGWVLSVYAFFLASLLALFTWVIWGIAKGFSADRRVPFGPLVALSTMIFGIGRVLDPHFITHLLTFRF